MKRYNGLNSIKIDLSACGICQACGRRFTDPKCEHATKEQIEYTKQLDAKIDAEYEQKRQAREIARDAEWLGVSPTRANFRVIANRFGSVRHPIIEEGCGNDADLYDWARGG